MEVGELIKQSRQQIASAAARAKELGFVHVELRSRGVKASVRRCWREDGLNKEHSCRGKCVACYELYRTASGVEEFGDGSREIES